MKEHKFNFDLEKIKSRVEGDFIKMPSNLKSAKEIKEWLEGLTDEDFLYTDENGVFDANKYNAFEELKKAIDKLNNYYYDSAYEFEMNWWNVKCYGKEMSIWCSDNGYDLIIISLNKQTKIYTLSITRSKQNESTRPS